MNLKLDLVLFDMIGTTVKDTAHGSSVILESFAKAFQQNGIQVANEELNRQRGKTKRLAIDLILKQQAIQNELTERIYKDFMNELIHNIDSFVEMPGAALVFNQLKSIGIKIGIGSGLPLSFINRLIDHLNWKHEDFDYINSSDELGKSRPDPIMIEDAMQQLGVFDSQAVLKIGDTINDVLEGKNGGVMTAMVLTGTQTKNDLGNIEPDFILKSISDIPQISE